MTEEEIKKWIGIEATKAFFSKEEEVKIKLYLCPKSDKCVMDCHHKIPHEFEKFCDQNHRVNKESQCPSCVEELAADITFFPEDFEIV